MFLIDAVKWVMLLVIEEISMAISRGNIEGLFEW
jgi:hypothetical protein